MHTSASFLVQPPGFKNKFGLAIFLDYQTSWVKRLNFTMATNILSNLLYANCLFKIPWIDRNLSSECE